LAKGGGGTAGGAPSGGAAVAVARPGGRMLSAWFISGPRPLEPRSAGLRREGKNHDRYSRAGPSRGVALRDRLCVGYLAWVFVAWVQPLHATIPADDKDY